MGSHRRRQTQRRLQLRQRALVLARHRVEFAEEALGGQEREGLARRTGARARNRADHPVTQGAVERRPPELPFGAPDDRPGPRLPSIVRDEPVARCHIAPQRSPATRPAVGATWRTDIAYRPVPSAGQPGASRRSATRPRRCRPARGPPDRAIVPPTPAAARCRACVEPAPACHFRTAAPRRYRRAGAASPPRPRHTSHARQPIPAPPPRSVVGVQRPGRRRTGRRILHLPQRDLDWRYGAANVYHSAATVITAPRRKPDPVP